MTKLNAAGNIQQTGGLEEIFASMGPELYSLVVGCETEQPLQEAFSGKRVLHSDLKGQPLRESTWADVWQTALKETGRGEKRSAYVHIPFCRHKCLYCGFFQNFCQEELETAYIDRLIAELQMYAGSPCFTAPIHAVFIGGGTPSCLSPFNIGRLLRAIHTYLPLANDYELTLEGRIRDLVTEKMDCWFENGVNRISLGVQSFQTKVRRSVGRLDDRETILERLTALSAYSQASVIIDLLYGLPYQTKDVWLEDVMTLKAAAVDGWDLYQLNVYENSMLKKAIETGRLPAGAVLREQAEMFAMAHQILQQWPVDQISVCHWSKSNRERNLYNSAARQGHTRFPFGAGAGGRVSGISLMQDRDVKRYIKRIDAGEKPIVTMLKAHASADLYDEVKYQLKLGYLDIGQLASTFDARIFELNVLLDLWEKQGLLVRSGDLIRLTVAGQFWYVNMTQSILECLNALLHDVWSWSKQKKL